METVRKPRPYVRSQSQGVTSQGSRHGADASMSGGQARSVSPSGTYHHYNGNQHEEKKGDSPTHGGGEHHDHEEDAVDEHGIPIEKHQRQPRRSSGWRQAPELLRKKAQYGHTISALRGHEVDDEAAEGLVARGEPLLEWALRGIGTLAARRQSTAGPGPASMRAEMSFVDGNMHNNTVPGGPSLHLGGGGGGMAAGLGGLRPGLHEHHNHQHQRQHNSDHDGLDGDMDDIAAAEATNAAIVARQVDMARAALVAGGRWKGEKPAAGGISAGQSCASINCGSFGGSVVTPQGSAASGAEHNVVRTALELSDGPHLHLQIVQDAATGPEDVGAGVGSTGRLPPVRGGLSRRASPSHDAAVGINSDAEDAGANVLDPHPSWANSIVMGRSGAVQQAVRPQVSLGQALADGGQLPLSAASAVGAGSSSLVQQIAEFASHAASLTLGSSPGAGIGLGITSAGHVGAGAAISTARGWPPVAIEGSVGSQAFARVRMCNTGSTVLYYKWTPSSTLESATEAGGGGDNSSSNNNSLSPSATLPLDGGGSIVSATTGAMENMQAASKLSNTASTIHHANAPSQPPPLPRFLCPKMAGSVVPGGTVDFIFSFQADAPGVYREYWSLSTSPVANEGASIRISLRGVATIPDETGPRRQRLETRLRDAAVFSAVHEVVLSIIDSLQFAPPPPATEEEARAERSARFSKLNPGLHYSDAVYFGLEKCAQEAYSALQYSDPGDKQWDGSIDHLVGVVQQLVPYPETREERREREELESKALEEARARAEVEAKAEAEAAAAAAAAATEKKGSKGAKPAAASPGGPAGKRPGSGSGRPGTASAAGLETAAAAASSSVEITLASIPPVVGPAQRRQEAVVKLREDLQVRVTSLAVEAAARPIEDSPIYSIARAMICELVDAIPFIAGGVREAEKQQMIEHAVPAALASSEPESCLWSDQRPDDKQHADILAAIYGRKGRPAPKIRRTRMKLGRDGEYHEVPIDADEDLDQNDDDDDDEDDDLTAGGHEDEQLDPADVAARISWKGFSRQLAKGARAAQLAVEEQQRAAAEAASAAAAAAAAAAEAEAAAASKKGAAATGKGGKADPKAAAAAKQAGSASQSSLASTTSVGSLPPAIGSSPPATSLSAAQSTADLASSASAAAAQPIVLKHPLSALVPDVPEDGTQQYAYLSRFAFATKRCVQRMLSKLGSELADKEAGDVHSHRVKNHMVLASKLSLADVDVSGRIALVRADYDNLPNALLRAAAAEVDGKAVTASIGSSQPIPSAVALLAAERHVTASISSFKDLLARGSRLVVVAAAQGRTRLPYPDDEAAGKGQPVLAWPHADASSAPSDGGGSGALGTCEAAETVLDIGAVLPPAAGSQADVIAREDEVEVAELEIAAEEAEAARQRAASEEASAPATTRGFAADGEGQYLPAGPTLSMHDNEEQRGLRSSSSSASLLRSGSGLVSPARAGLKSAQSSPASASPSRPLTAAGHRPTSAAAVAASRPAPVVIKTEPLPPATAQVLRTYTSSSFTGLAAALSLLVPQQVPVVLSGLTGYDRPRVWINGHEITAASTDSSKGLLAALMPALHAAADRAADFAEFTRALSANPSMPQAVVLLDNLLHPDTYAAETGSKPLYGFTRQRKHLPLPFHHPQLDARNVSAWEVRHVALWLQSMCPGIQNADDWRKYVRAFAADQVDGQTLLGWLEGAIAEKPAPPPVPVAPQPVLAPAPSTSDLLKSPAPASGSSRPGTAAGTGKGGKGSASASSIAPASPVPVPVPVVLEPVAPPAPAAPEPTEIRLQKKLIELGITGDHLPIIFSGLSRLRARHEIEVAAAAREESINVWAESQANTASSVINEGLARMAATMQIQALMRGYIARRRAAMARGRQMRRAQERQVSGKGAAVKPKPGKGKGGAMTAEQLRLISGAGGATSPVSSSGTGETRNLNEGLLSHAPSTADHSHQVRFAAFSAPLTAHAFISKATRGQAAVRAILSSCCDVFVQDSLAASIVEGASTTGVRPARAAIVKLISGSTAGVVAPSAWVRDHGAVAFKRTATIRGKKGSDMAKATAAAAAAASAHVAYDASNPAAAKLRAATAAGLAEDEAAAIEIQRVMRGKHARREVAARRAAASTSSPTASAEHNSSSGSSLPSSRVARVTHQQELVPGEGTRVLGLSLAADLRVLGSLIQSDSINNTSDNSSSSAGSGPRKPVLSILGGGSDLRAKVAALERLIRISEVVALGGLIGWAWAAHVGVPVQTGSGPVQAVPLPSQAWGATPTQCSYWMQAGNDLRRLAAFAAKRGVRIIVPVDATVAAEPFDVRYSNPSLLATATSLLSVGVANPTAESVSLALVASHGKGIPGEEIEDEVDPEDEIPDEDYDSDSTQDMERLRDRNLRRKAKSKAAAASRAARRAAGAARLASRPVLPDEFDPILRPSVSSTSGIQILLPPNPRGQSIYELPDSESAGYEWDWERPLRTVDIRRAAAGLAGASSATQITYGDLQLLNPSEAPIDIGPASLEAILDAIAEAGTVLVYGPTGVVEVVDGSVSTNDILQAAAGSTKSRGVTTVLGGGAAAAYARRAGLALDSFSGVCEAAAVLLCNNVVPGIALVTDRE